MGDDRDDLVIWLVAIAWSGWSIPALLLASAMALPRRSTGC
jgi:hypothetical protein